MQASGMGVACRGRREEAGSPVRALMPSSEMVVLDRPPLGRGWGASGFRKNSQRSLLLDVMWAVGERKEPRLTRGFGQLETSHLQRRRRLPKERSVIPFGGFFWEAWKRIKYEDLGFKHIDFEIPITHLRVVIENSFR